MWNAFSRMVALRHLRYNIAQTLLTMGVVAVSVTLIVFITALISGLQKRLISSITGSLAHITVQQEEREPTALWELEPDEEDRPLYGGTRERLSQRTRRIEDWQAWVPRIEGFSRDVVGVSPVVQGQAFLQRGERRDAVSITGMIPQRHNRIVDIESNLVQGRFFGISGGEAAVGRRLADDFGLRLDDRVRITSSEGVSASFRIVGIFDTGFQLVDARTVFVTLRDGQSLFELGRAVTGLDVEVRDVFAADVLARRMSQQIPYDVEPWTEENAQLLSALRRQSQTSQFIVGFVVLSAGFGIASILVTSVVSKLKEIGILKAMGATQKQIVGIFTLESVLMSAMGGFVGSFMGAGFSILSYRISVATTDRPEDVFTVDIRWQTMLGAIVIAVAVGFFASIYPARRAARINPIDVIRGA